MQFIYDPPDVTAPSEEMKNQKRYQVSFLYLVQKGRQWKILFYSALPTLNNNQRQRRRAFGFEQMASHK